MKRWHIDVDLSIRNLCLPSDHIAKSKLLKVAVKLLSLYLCLLESSLGLHNIEMSGLFLNWSVVGGLVGVEQSLPLEICKMGPGHW